KRYRSRIAAGAHVVAGGGLSLHPREVAPLQSQVPGSSRSATSSPPGSDGSGLRVVIQGILPNRSVSPARRYRLFVPRTPKTETRRGMAGRWGVGWGSNAVGGSTPLRSGELASGGWS